MEVESDAKLLEVDIKTDDASNPAKPAEPLEQNFSEEHISVANCPEKAPLDLEEQMDVDPVPSEEPQTSATTSCISEADATSPVNTGQPMEANPVKSPPTDPEIALPLDDITSQVNVEMTPQTDANVTSQVDAEISPQTHADTISPVDTETTPQTDAETTSQTDTDITAQTDADITPQTDEELTPQIDTDLTVPGDAEITSQAVSELVPPTGNDLDSTTDAELPLEVKVDPTPLGLEDDQEKDTVDLTDELILQTEDDPLSSQLVESSQAESVEAITGNALEPATGDHLEPTIVAAAKQTAASQEASADILNPDLEDLVELPDSLNNHMTTDQNLLEPDEDSGILEESQGVLATNILEEAARRIEPNKWKPKGGSFSLGVPGLTFSAQNLKVASDGTKMVQIHQSQITASQLEALQSNPNIKVVFRHIPSGKSFTKPPKNLFSQPKKNGVKRKLEDDDDNADDSIYNFDEFEDDENYDVQPKAKVPNMGNGNTKFARYNPNVGFKRKVGRPRIIPDSSSIGSGAYAKPVLPAQIQLTDALVKLNKPGATHTVKVHVKQVSHDILINMELNPKYNIVLTAKHEVPPEHSLEELVKEWEEKETIEQPESEKPIEKEVEKSAEEVTPEEENAIIIDVEAEKEKQREEQRIKKEKQAEQQKAREKQKLLGKQKEKAESELLSAALLEQKSRSGRIRKPSRFSLDIAKMTKRHSLPGDVPVEKETMKTPTPPRNQTPIKTPPPPSVLEGARKRKGRGRPKKIKKEPLDSSVSETSPQGSPLTKKSEIKSSSPSISTGPVVMLSPADKRVADKQLLQSSPRKNDIPEKEATITSPSKENKEIASSDIEESNETAESQRKEDMDTPSTSQSSKDTNEVMVIDDSTTESEKPETETHGKQDGAKTVKDKDLKTEIESPSDILARKLSKESVTDASKESTKNKDDETTASADFFEDEENVDNKYRLRKLLQQCSIEEIRSVAIPRALDIISIGDFFIHKADQMSTKDVSYTSLYSQLEDLHTCVEKESIRYSTLLRRANKVGGDRRMEKVILMPVYNKQAAESLHISSSSIDAHIGGIYQKPTTPMIAANSFHMNCKMKPPVHRLKLPELNDRNQARKKRGGGVFPPSQRYDANTPIMNPTFRPRGSWKRGYQVRKPNYLGDQVRGAGATSLQEHARMQLASRYQAQLMAKESTVVTSTVIGAPTTSTLQAGQKTIVHGTLNSGKIATTQGDATAQINTTLSSDLTTQATTVPVTTEAAVVNEEGATVVAEDGKQLVSIGDGQYVELPEGYTLIQTDEGYIIGQPGATFVQGDDGNVYMTSTEEGGADITDQVLTTTAAIGEEQQPAADEILGQLSQT